MAVLTFLTILTIILLPVGELGRYVFPSTGSVPLVLNDVLAGITVGYWLLYKLQKKEAISGTLCIPILLFLAGCLLSLLVNSTVLSLPQLFISSLYILRWGVYAGLYFVIKDFPLSLKKKIMYVLVIIGQIIVGIGYLQFFIYPSLRNLYYLGWDEHLYRMFSVFLDPNFAGVFFVLVFLLTFGIGIQKYKEKQYAIVFILSVFSFLDVVAVYLTYSRSALLMLVISIFFFLWYLGEKRYIVTALVFLFLLLVFSPKSFQTEGTNIFRIASSEARIESGQRAIEIAIRHPIFGVGFNAYRYAQNRLGYLTDKKWGETHAGAGTDNSYLFVLATTGIVGIGMYLYLLSRMVAMTVKKRDVIHVVAVSSLIGVFISSLFINSLFYIFIMEWLWILLGTTEHTSRG